MSTAVESSSLVGRVKMFHNSLFKSSKANANGVSHDKSGSNISSTEKTSAGNANTVQAQPDNNAVVSDDELFLKLRREAAEVAKREPILTMLLSKVGLLDNPAISNYYSTTTSSISPSLDISKSQPATSFDEAIARIVAHRLSSCSGGSAMMCPIFLQHIIQEGFASDELELGHTMSEAVREDALAVWRRDPACETLLEVVLFMKGFLSLVIHRAARRAWKPEPGEPGYSDKNNEDDYSASIKGTRFVALLLQSQASSAFGVDIHPAAQIGAGVMIDHATGVVIGETATVGDGTTILHGVTLGGTGKESGDRHPKIGKDVLIGAGTKILGNIKVGCRAKIGAGSVVLRPIPSGATAVGAPAKIIGFTPKGERPGSSVDISLAGVEPLMGTKSLAVSAESKPKLSRPSSELMSKTIHEQDKGIEGDTEELTSVETDEVGIDIEDEDSGNTDDSEDDDLTDFGTRASIHWVKMDDHNDDMCPFRNSFCPESGAKDMISHKKLRALLLQEGCSDGETVEVFFELLHLVPIDCKARQSGCIPLDIFARYFPEIGPEKTRLDEETCRALAKGDLRKLGMSKKASKRFKSMFKQLGRIPSSNALTSGLQHRGSSGLSNQDKGVMEGFLDTSEFAEGIAI